MDSLQRLRSIAEMTEVSYAFVHLEEGFGSFVRSVLHDDIEEDIDELRKDIKDIKTPEERKLLLIRCLKLLRQALIMRHNWSPTKKYLAGMVDKATGKDDSKGKKDPIATTNANLKKAITDLTLLRDKILKLDVRGTADFEDRLKDEIRKMEGSAGSERLDASDY